MKTRLFRAFRALILLSCLASFSAKGENTGSTGGTDPINNEQPTVQLRYIIAIHGILPSTTTGASSADSDPMVGEIRMFAGNFIPGGWMECNGAVLDMDEYEALSLVVGSHYGGNGTTTFALPDLRGRVPVGAGPGMPVGTVTGAAQITLTEGQMPAHAHSIPGASTDVSGSSAAVNNVQPSLAVTFLLARDSVFQYVGEIRMFAGDFVPAGWLACDGQLLNINTHTALFSKLGTAFGGNGSNTFGLPDLRGRTPIGLGVGPSGATYEIGNYVGADTVTLDVNQLPSHSHSTGGSATGSTGGGQSVNNIQRSLALTMAVRLEGVYPTDSGSVGSQFIGDVRFFGFYPNYIVNNMPDWKLAQGNLLSFSSGDAYPMIVGSLYGGNGSTTAGVPEGRGRAVKGASSSAGMATLNGTPHYTLSEAQMPAHTHTVAVVSFSAATYSVNQGATDVALTLERTDTTTAASITVVTDDGSASTIPPFSAAVAGIDYTDLVGSAGVADFAIGESTKTIHVTLIPKTPATTPNKRFVATLAYPNAVLPGAVSTTTIQILANDTMLPTLTLTAPAAPAGTAASTNVSATSPFVVKGVAGDAKGVARVEVVLNSAPPVNAVLGSATSNAAVPYSLNIVPLSGANTLVVTSFDLRGNSKTISRNFNFTQRYNLSLERIAPVALDTAGTLTLAATPGTAASALTPTTANANPKTTTVVPGTTVKLTATAKVGYFFSHWDYAPSGATYLGNILTFTMPAHDVPAIVANFVANPFFAPAGAGNAFHGLIHATVGATPSNSTEGYFTGTLSPTNGLFTGKVLINGLSQSFIFYFYGNGYGLFNVGTTKQETLAFGGKSLAFYYDDNADAIYATVDHNGGGGTSLSTGEATRTIYSATNKVPADMLNQTVPATAPAPNKGFFTVGFPSKDQSPPMDLTTYPQGDGFATVTVTDVGLVSLSGTLADGTVITGSSAVVFGNQCPIWVQLVTPGAAAANKGGSFGGVLTFDTSPADSDVTGVDLTWFRPTVTALTTPATAAAATNLYTAGWPVGIRVDAVGALYNKDTTVQAGLAIGSPNALYGNARLDFTSGKLVPSVTKTNFNISANAVTKIPTSDGSFTLSLMATTGGFSGLFTPNWASPSTVKPAYKGIIIQKGASKGGFGFFLSNAKNDLDPESGAVYLGAQ